MNKRPEEEKFAISKINENDSKTFELFKHGDTVGIFSTKGKKWWSKCAKKLLTTESGSWVHGSLLYYSTFMPIWNFSKLKKLEIYHADNTEAY